MKHREPARRLVTTGEVARRFSRVAVAKWIHSGKLVGHRTPGSHFRIPAEQLTRLDAPRVSSSAAFDSAGPTPRRKRRSGRATRS
jgi:excisionase family DNA binding protein